MLQDATRKEGRCRCCAVCCCDPPKPS
jgi:hypothetical protein